MNRRLLIIVIFTVFLPYNIFCQYSPVYNHYFDNEFILNPAFTGRNYYPVVNAGIRKQWAGIDNTPATSFAGANFRLGSYNFYTPKMMLNKSKFESKERLGFGGYLFHDKDGPLQTNSLIATHAYFIPLGHGELSFGLSAKVLFYLVDKSMFKPMDEVDMYLLEFENKLLTFDSDFGVYYGLDQFYAGIAIGDLFESNNRLGKNSPFHNERDFFISGGYKFFLKYFELEPSVFIHIIDDRDPGFDARAKLYYQNFNWIEIGYRSTNSLLVSLAIKYQMITIGYRYEQNLNKLANYYMNANEFIIGLNFGLNKVAGIRKVVR